MFVVVAAVAQFLKPGGPVVAQPSASVAHAICVKAVTAMAKDPETVKVPWVEPASSADAHIFEWGRTTRLIRMRNGLGLEVPVSGKCVVDARTMAVLRATIQQ